MARKTTPAEIREMNITATQRLASTIREHSGLKESALEGHFGFGADSPFGGKTGTHWKRYEQGKRTIQMAERRDQMAREALLQGWLPNGIPTYLDERWAWGSLRGLMERLAAGESITAADVAEDRKRWLDWSRKRNSNKQRETKALRRLVARVQRDMTALADFLDSVNGDGHDYWDVVLPDRDVVVDQLGNTQTIDGAADLGEKMDEMKRLVQTIELKVLHEFSADMIPPSPIPVCEGSEPTN